jgi:hypothetical protein
LNASTSGTDQIREVSMTTFEYPSLMGAPVRQVPEKSLHQLIFLYRWINIKWTGKQAIQWRVCMLRSGSKALVMDIFLASIATP